MDTDKNKKRTSSQVMELKDLISGPLVATIDADSISSRRYLNYLFELAFDSYDKETGKVGELRTLEFKYKVQDAGGAHYQSIKIPILTLVPLPLLQVKEANFDFDIQIIDAVSTDKQGSFSLKNKAEPNLEDQLSGEGVKLRVAMAERKAEGSVKTGSKQSLTANMKVKVKMEQSDMPAGLLKLLHLTTNNTLIESVDEQDGNENRDSDNQ